MNKLFAYFKNYIPQTVLAPLFKFMEATLELIVPLIIASIIDVGIGTRDTGFILRRGGLLVLFAAVGLGLAVTAQYFSAKAAIGVCTDIRASLLDKVQSFSYGRLDGIGPSTLVTRMTSDVNTLQTGINLTLRLLLRSPFVVFGAMVVAFTIDAKCALIFAAVIAVLLVIVFAILLSAIPKHGSVQKALDDITSSARENLTGVRVIRAFLREEAETKEFKKRSARLEKLQLAVGRVSGLLNPATLVAVNAAVIVLLWTGAIRVDSGTLSQGQVVALYNLLSQILVELVKMANLVINIAKAAACGKRISAVLSAESGGPDGRLLPDEDAPLGRIEFKNVGFTYENAGAPSLSAISFTAESGQTVGIIGGTGSGKSTLVNLIAGFYRPTEGEARFDGVPLADFKPVSLRNRISVVPQRAVLLAGSIRSNLLMGDPGADEAKMEKALADAQALDFVREKEGGLDAPVLKGSSNFSGGQKQRLCIARALMKPSEVLILDDSTSALDYATDARLRAALAERSAGRKQTTLIVSQRTASILGADLIIVLDEGRQIGLGTHAELLESCPVYREIYETQFPPKECGGEASA
jgi:ABC-type multidrug transport system fused ATPase/permease subunit